MVFFLQQIGLPHLHPQAVSKFVKLEMQNIEKILAGLTEITLILWETLV
jgi:hypothetical protein